MEPSPPPPPPNPEPRPRPDPDFAAEPFAATAFPPGFTPAEHQRLVVNPFLAVAALIGWAWLTRQAFASEFPPAAILPSLLLAGLPVVIQTHCLDCGQTGSYPRWRRHACPKVVLRARNDRRSWFRWPSARFQLILWGYVLGVVGVLVVVVVLLARA